ncbi:Uncharacterised protein [Mycobacterium tuberculosis]|nr:Uncharacterised protein [Mycobacterium tuberculosis]CKP78130.1 Uncharacterised protein [Mycobacterium tuberculosis]CKP83927.1 Uncharacterised protein [Mycobacterium tuberculosis]
MQTVRLNMTPPANRIALNVTNRLRSRNKWNGTTGFSAVRSTMTNATAAAKATRPEPMVMPDIQPFSGPIEKAKTAAVHASVASMAPVASSFIRSLLVSRRAVRAR